jgi:GTP cyclohydrolase II
MSNPHTSFEFVSRAKLPTKFGQFTIHGFVDTSNNQEHIALSHGEWSAKDIVPIRIHSECLTGDALFSTKCDCGFQLERALQNIVANGAGVLLYLRQEGRGIGLLNKIKAYSLQDEGMDTVEANEHLGFDADMRDYSICKTILDTLEIQRVELMTNNPKKLDALIEMGIDVVSCQAIDHGVTDANRDYLKTKAEKLGHTFSSDRLK